MDQNQLIKNGLIGHWPLAGDTRDYSGHGWHGTNHGADLNAPGPGGHTVLKSSAFDGRKAWIEVPAGALTLEASDFSILARIHTDAVMDDVPGDILSNFDPEARRGFNLGLLSLPGVTASQPNDRNLQFGIDNARLDPWENHGRVGDARFVMSLCVHKDGLYAGTSEEIGRVYRFSGGKEWVDCGAPDGANAVTSMAVLDGELYVGTGKYRYSGSALPETKNEKLGGSVFRYKADKKWEDCGRVSLETEKIGGLVVFRGKLYATSAYKPAGLFRYDGGKVWTPLGSMDGRRSEALGVYNGKMYTSVWDGGSVFEFDGEKFVDLGYLEPAAKNTQTYGFLNHRGELLVATWPNGKLYRWAGGQKWIDAGRLGSEMEVMATAHYNGKAYAGSLPLGKVFRYDDGECWTELGQLDFTPDVLYRRVWSAAVFSGRLFFGTLPAGTVHSIQAGRVASVDRTLEPGWRRIAAIRRAGRLEVYVDGRKAAESAFFEAAEYNLTNGRALRIGAGENDFFNGRIADLRIYQRALTSTEIQQF